MTSGRRRACVAVLVGSLAGCGSTAPSPSALHVDAGPSRDTGAPVTPVSAATGRAGPHGESGKAGPALTGEAAAGGSSGVAAMAGSSELPKAGASGTNAGVRPCAIPNEIMILDEDADGGVATRCQDVPRKIIAENCIGGICHDSNGPPAAGLDLMMPCIADRMVNVKSHCQDLLIIDTAHPAASFLLDKLNSAKPKCGESMPFTGHLLPADLQCANAWVHAVIRAAK